MDTKIIIAGSRAFTDYELLKAVMDNYIKDKGIPTIISGGARGADALGERWARRRGFRVKLMLAEWSIYGKSAGYKRNERMAVYADELVAFWDGKSKGTKNMIELAEEHGLNYLVVQYDKNNGIAQFKKSTYEPGMVTIKHDNFMQT